MVETVCPRLSEQVAFRNSGAGANLLLQHLRYRSQLMVDASSEAALRAMDGEHSLEDIEALLPGGPGRFTYRDLSLLLFQLWDRGFLANGDEVRQALFPHHRLRTLDRETRWRGVRGLFGSALMGEQMSRLLMSRGTIAALLLLALYGLYALASGLFQWPENLFRLKKDWVSGFVLFYGSSAAMLSARGLLRAMILATEGTGLRQVGLRQNIGLVYFDVDDREVYHLDQDVQLRFSALGILLSPALAGLLVLSGLTATAPWAANVAAVAVLLGFINLCPFFATDGARLVEQFSGVARQRFRVRTFITRELVRGLFSATATSQAAGLRYSVVASLWFLWFFGAVKVVALLIFDHLTVLQSVVLASDSAVSAVVSGVLLAYSLTLVIAIVWVFASMSVDLITQVFQRRGVDAPLAARQATALSDDQRASLVNSIRKLTTGENLSGAALDEVLGGVEHRQFGSGSWILRVGSSEAVYFWVLSGRVELLQPLPEGEDRFIASLGPGESFGPGLEQDAASSWDVRATEDSTLLALDTAALHRFAAEQGEDSVGVRRLLERLQFLAEVPVLASLGPSARLDLASGAEDLAVEAGHPVILQGEEADALYLVRSGRVKVEQAAEDGSVSQLAELGSGATFGEMGLLFQRPRSATVTSVEPSSLVRVPRAVVEEVMSRSFHVGLALEDLASERGGRQ